ncbi:MAG: DRTGG domain-containing protein [Clostridia bacterium]
MKVSEICTLLDAEVVVGKDKMDLEIRSACGSDMMSDVLAFVKNKSILLTGLVNPQVVRTAEMMDMGGVVFVRGKVPDQTIIDLAEDMGMVLLTTTHRLFTACGILYSNGLIGDEK